MILPLQSETTLETSGGKGANLSRLTRAGLPVPPGFIVTTQAYRDYVAGNQMEGWLLDSAARRLHLPLAKAPKLVDADRMVLGRYVIPDVGVWAFQHRVGETSNVIQGEVAYYVFRLDSLAPDD